MGRKKRAEGVGALAPHCDLPLIDGVPTLRAANHNGRGRRVVVLKNFGNVPLLIDEIAVVDRLMQDATTAANDNRAD
jgi:hypothetical protein